MAPSKRRILFATISIVFCVRTASLGRAASISITSPSPGTIVTPGQTILVTVQPAAGTLLQRVMAGIAPLNQIPQVIQTPPYQFSVQVPSGQVGTVSVNALALDTLGNTLQASVNVVVQSSVPAVSIQVTPKRLIFTSADGQIRSVSVSATFQDGTSGYVTNSPQSQYVSSNTTVAIVNSIGQVQPVAPGLSNLAITYTGFSATVPISVGVFPLKGDLNGDGAVDQNDIQVLLAALNTSSTGPGDPRDLNNDGRIDGTDSQILATLCSRPGCATDFADTTPPVILPQVTGTLGSNGWYRSNVMVSWSVSDPESGIASSSGCNATNLTTDTAGITLTCKATNGAGLTSSVPVTIKIDKTPPVISGMLGASCTLWPPNHKLVRVATVTATDALSGLAPVTFKVTGTSNEPSDPNEPEVVITPNGAGGFNVQLQADRLGTGTGRIYTLTATAADLAGNAATATAICTVPHDQGN